MNTCVDTHVRFSAWVYGQNTKFPNYRGNLKMKRFSMCVCTVFYLPCKSCSMNMFCFCIVSITTPPSIQCSVPIFFCYLFYGDLC